MKDLSNLVSSLGLPTALSVFLIAWIILTLDKNLKKILENQSKTFDRLDEFEKSILEVIQKFSYYQKLEIQILKKLAEKKGIEIIGGD